MQEIPISLLISTYIGGLAAGSFIFYTCIRLFFPDLIKDSANGDDKQGLAVLYSSFSAKIITISFILLALGLLASATHLGQPFRFLNALANPKSMLTQEAYWSITFAILLLGNIIMFLRGKESKILLAITSVVGVGFLLVTSLVYTKTTGIPAWNHGVTPIFFLFSAILMGSVVCLGLLTRDEENQEIPRNLILVFIGLLIAQILIAVSFILQLTLATKGVQLPGLLGLNIARWIIGLIAPLVIVYMVFKESISPQLSANILLITVLIGEAFSRVIFFANGIHL